MSLWVNENGVMKEISIDKDDVTIKRVKIQIPMYTGFVEGAWSCETLGITRIKLVPEVTQSGNTLGVDWTATQPENPGYDNIEPEYIFTMKRGKFPTKLPFPSNVGTGSSNSATYYESLRKWFEHKWLNQYGSTFKNNTEYTNPTDHTVKVLFARIIEDENEQTWRIDAYALRTSRITEANALTSKLYVKYPGYSGTSSTAYCFNSTYHFTPITYQDSEYIVN